MNKEYKPANNTFREHFKLYGYLSTAMIEELLDKVDSLNRELQECITSLEDADQEATYWREKYEYIP